VPTVSLFLVLAAISTSAQPSAKQRLHGTWELTRWEVFDAAGGPSRPGTYDRGRVIYDAGSGNMSAHLMSSANKADSAPATDADRAAAYRRYLGYWGPYTVDEKGGVITHHVAGSSNPSWVGTEQIRYFALTADGNRLTLSLKNGDRVTQSLYWERVK
jgi:hypothetical protein